MSFYFKVLPNFFIYLVFYFLKEGGKPYDCGDKCDSDNNYNDKYVAKLIPWNDLGLK